MSIPNHLQPIKEKHFTKYGDVNLPFSFWANDADMIVGRTMSQMPSNDIWQEIREIIHDGYKFHETFK